MERYKKASLVALWLYFIISTAVTFHEYSSITVGRGLYLWTKIVLQVWLLAICLWYPTNPYGVAQNLMVGIHVIVSNIQGQYFIPWYVFSFLEMIIAFSFLCPLPRKHFNIFLFMGTGAFLGVSLYRYDAVHKWVYASAPADLVTTTLSAAAVAWLCHNFFTADHTQREELVRKFGIVGVQAATIVHDIKSMLSAPRLYTDLIKQRVPEGDVELADLVDNLEKQLLHINRAVTGLNQVVALQDQKKEDFDIRLIACEVADTLGLGSRGIELDIVGDVHMISEKAMLKSILFNLMMNSIHAFRKNKIASPIIRIVCDGEGLTFSDNAGGFPAMILDSLKEERFEAFDGTGMGLFLVQNGVRTLGGRVSFANGKEGAQIRIVVAQRATRAAKRSLGALLGLT